MQKPTDSDPSIVQAPLRFRSISVDHQLPQQSDQRQRSQHTIGLPPFKPRSSACLDRSGRCSSHRSPSNRTSQASRVQSGDLQQTADVGTKSGNAEVQRHTNTVISGSGRAVAAPTTQQAPKALSLMGLINEAARNAELEEIALAKRRAAANTVVQTKQKAPIAAQISSMATSSPNSMPACASAVKASQCVPGQQTTAASDTVQHSMASAAIEESQQTTTAGAAAKTTPQASNSTAQPECLHQQQQQQQRRHPSQDPARFVLPEYLVCSSDCGSDGSTTPPACLSSSASSSSLNSAASFLSAASSNSNSLLKPKSILLTRTSIGSSCSSGSSFSKRVTWKDGQSDEETVGHELVTVRVMDDDPDVRQLRKDTWPERPGARRDLLDQQVAAAAEEAKKQQQQQQQQQQTSLVGKLLQEPTKLRDWREKLRQLQADRRQQRLAQVQAVWERQQRKLAKQDDECTEQQQEQQEPDDAPLHAEDQQSVSLRAQQQSQQSDEVMDVDDTAALKVSGVKGAAVAAGVSCGSVISINAVAATSRIKAAS